MTHSFLVTIVGAEGPDPITTEAMFAAFVDFIARPGGAGARAAGDAAEDAVDTAGDAMSLRLIVKLRSMTTNTAS